MVFWFDVESYVNRKLKTQKIQIKKKDVLTLYSQRETDYIVKYIVNFLILLGKYFLHESKWASKWAKNPQDS